MQPLISPQRNDFLICMKSVFCTAEGVDMKDFLSYVNADRFKSFMEAATMQTVALSMPKFKVNTTLIMNSLLQSMGVHKAFSGAADFSAMTQAVLAESVCTNLSGLQRVVVGRVVDAFLHR